VIWLLISITPKRGWHPCGNYNPPTEEELSALLPSAEGMHAGTFKREYGSVVSKTPKLTNAMNQ
jgi:hypothetical protein